MRTCLTLLLFSLAAPAHAGTWRGSYDVALTPGLNSHGVVPLQLATEAAFSPWSTGPLLSIGSNPDVISDSRLSRHGLGVTFPVSPDIALGSQVELVTQSGDAGYQVGLGFEGHADWVFHRFEQLGMGLGLELRGGSAPFLQDQSLWWSSAGLKLTFGNTRGL